MVSISRDLDCRRMALFRHPYVASRIHSSLLLYNGMGQQFGPRDTCKVKLKFPFDLEQVSRSHYLFETRNGSFIASR